MLVVGASATGVQIADEIRRSGREVVLAVGEHVRAPRVYRDRDIHWWMEVAGVLDERYDEVDDIVRARRVPSMQLAGSAERATYDLNVLPLSGSSWSGSSPASTTAGRSSQARCATSASSPISNWAASSTPSTSGPSPTASTTRCRHRTGWSRPWWTPLRLSASTSTAGRSRPSSGPPGFRPDYSWLDVDVLDYKGMVRHDGGVVDSPGMYLIGTPFLRRRKSSFIDGARADAQELDR